MYTFEYSRSLYNNFEHFFIVERIRYFVIFINTHVGNEFFNHYNRYDNYYLLGIESMKFELSTPNSSKQQSPESRFITQNLIVIKETQQRRKTLNRHNKKDT